MIERLRQVRLTPLQLALVALFSTVTTALIITSANGHSAAQSAVLAALRHRETVVQGSGGAQSTADNTGAGLDSGNTGAADSSGGSGSSSAAQTAASGNTGLGNTGVGNTGVGNTGATTTTTTTTTSSSSTAAAKLKHVFVIALTTTSFDAAFGQDSVAHYLNHTLRPKGAFLGGYETLGGTELPDYLALVSGQPPNSDTNQNCPTYAEYPSGTAPDSSGVIASAGCVYPNTVISLADQATAAGKTWKGYIDDMTPWTCVHPDSDAPNQGPFHGAGAQYDTLHNPFIYFHSLLDLGGCSSNDVSLTELSNDLQSASKTPTLAFLGPRACDDAAATSCPDGSAAGMAGQDQFLKTWVPKILDSSAYKHEGMLVITFALTGGGPSTRSAPVGALVLSPLAKANQAISTVYNPYSMLRSIEDGLGYKPLAEAAKAKSFVSEVLSAGG